MSLATPEKYPETSGGSFIARRRLSPRSASTCSTTRFDRQRWPSGSAWIMSPCAVWRYRCGWRARRWSQLAGQRHGADPDPGPQYPDRSGVERAIGADSGFGPKRVAAPGIAFEDLPKIDLDAGQPQPTMTISTSRRAEAPVGARSIRAIDHARSAMTASSASAGVLSVARDWGGRARGEACWCRSGRHPQPSLGQPLVHGPEPRALWRELRGCGPLPGGNVFFAGDTGPGDLQWPDEARARRPGAACADPDRGLPVRGGPDGNGQPYRPDRCRRSLSAARRAEAGRDRHPLGYLPPVL